jgi:ABC-type antimicrobial peptide transport system permease subunit
MTLMLISVNERQAEFGLRMAVGARRTDIALQIAIETLILCVLGCLLGTASGILVLLFVAILMNSDLNLSLFWIVAVGALSIVLGIVSAIYPAVMAMRLNPVQALGAGRPSGLA